MAEQTYDPCVKREVISRAEMQKRIAEALREPSPPNLVLVDEAVYQLLWAILADKVDG